MNIGERIEAIRKVKGITQAELAENIGKERSVLSRYENGKVKVSIEVALKIASALRVPVTRLIQ